MASNQPSTSAPPAQEYIVRVSKDAKKKESILKSNPANNVDFTKVGKITLERENNYKEFKQAYDVDTMPKFGAGSEFGREAREEARKKKYGMKTRIYDPDDQPWVLKVGNESKNQRRFRGIKEGGVLENASYYIFTQCPDGAFEAFPVEDWYNFAPVPRYKVLNSEEAEKEYEKREKNVNYFNIMVRKRMKGEDDDADVDDDGKKVKAKKTKSKDFMLTELDEWAILSNSDESEGSENSGDGAEKKKKEKPKKKKLTKKKGKRRENSDDEALEDSDDLDEGKEVDYMTSSDSEDDVMFKEDGKTTSDKYEEKGVVEEDGLRKLINSDEEDEEEANKEEEKEEEEEETNKPKEGKKEGSDSESSSSSGSDSDVEKAEKDGSFASALFLSKAKNVKKSKSNESTPTSSRSATPTVGDDEKGKKRKGGETDSPMAKKSRVSTPTPGTTSTPSGGSSSDGINDETVRRYLMRKPMTTKELLIKFKHTGLSKEQRVTSLAQILKRLNPEKKKIKDQLYLSLKKPE